MKNGRFMEYTIRRADRSLSNGETVFASRKVSRIDRTGTVESTNKKKTIIEIFIKESVSREERSMGTYS